MEQIVALYARALFIVSLLNNKSYFIEMGLYMDHF